MIAYIPVLFAVIGILVYVLAANTKAQEIGRALFWTGFLVTMLALSNHVVHLLPS